MSVGQQAEMAPQHVTEVVAALFWLLLASSIPRIKLLELASKKAVRW